MTALGAIPAAAAATFEPDGTRLLAPPSHAGLEVRWPCSLAAAPGQTMPAGAAFIIAVESLDDDRVMIEARLEPERRGPLIVLPRQPGRSHRHWADGLIHLDVFIGEQRVLMLSLTSRGDLLYARSPLLGLAGLAGGAYDRACLRHASPRAVISSGGQAA
jgi:hypothetical protein